MIQAADVMDYLRENASPEKAVGMQRFFKTGKGQYAEGDRFLGIPNPIARQATRRFATLPLQEIQTLLYQDYHEMRTCALLIMVEQYRKGTADYREQLLSLYVTAAPTQINNWDLVDLSAPGIVGEYAWEHSTHILDDFASKDVLWEQRIAVVATLTLIRHGKLDRTLELVSRFLTHSHDLMHKACGWMLREVGKHDRAVLTEFLEKYRLTMPRTMLRYAIEHYPEAQRKAFLKK